MGHHSCCNKQKVRRGLWSPEEDEKLIQYITTHGHGSWSSVPKLAGLQRCGKSCRLRWINYLRPDLKRGGFSPQEESRIIELHRLVGNRWSQIAKQLPGRTDNEVKNFWNSSIKKKLMAREVDTSRPLFSLADGTLAITIHKNQLVSSHGYCCLPSPSSSLPQGCDFREIDKVLDMSSCPPKEEGLQSDNDERWAVGCRQIHSDRDVVVVHHSAQSSIGSMVDTPLLHHPLAKYAYNYHTKLSGVNESQEPSAPLATPAPSYASLVDELDQVTRIPCSSTLLASCHTDPNDNNNNQADYIGILAAGSLSTSSSTSSTTPRSYGGLPLNPSFMPHLGSSQLDLVP